MEDAIKLLEAGVNPSGARITLGAYAQRWLDEDMQPRYDARGDQYAGVAETTFANYARDMRRLQKYIGDVRLGELGVGQVAGSGEPPVRRRRRPVQEFGITNIAELVDLPDKAPVSVGAIVTNLRLRTTKKDDRMAWLTLADATGAIEAAVFPQAFERLDNSALGESPLREGAFLVARGRRSQEEATGSKLFVDECVLLGGKASRMSALMVAIQEQEPDEWSSAMGA